MPFAESVFKKRIGKWKKKYGEGVFALIFGGRGCEHSVSLAGACRFLTAAEGLFPIAPIYIDRDGGIHVFVGSADELGFGSEPSPCSLIPSRLICEGGKGGLYAAKRFVRIRRAMPLLHGDFGEDGTVQGLLSSLNIPFVGAETVSGAVCCDKAYAKSVAASVGVPVLPFGVLYEREGADAAIGIAERLGYPVFIKPCRLGSSIGAYPAGSREELISRVEDARRFAQRIIIEPALSAKRELECAYLSVGDVRIITPPGEAVSDHSFYDYEAKYKSNSTRIYARADVADEVSELARLYTERLSDALSVRHMARFDYFLSEDGELYFNEVNTMPGMTDGSLYPLMLDSAGVDFSALTELLLSEGERLW